MDESGELISLDESRVMPQEVVENVRQIKSILGTMIL